MIKIAQSSSSEAHRLTKETAQGLRIEGFKLRVDILLGFRDWESCIGPRCDLKA